MAATAISTRLPMKAFTAWNETVCPDPPAGQHRERRGNKSPAGRRMEPPVIYRRAVLSAQSAAASLADDLRLGSRRCLVPDHSPLYYFAVRHAFHDLLLSTGDGVRKVDPKPYYTTISISSSPFPYQHTGALPPIIYISTGKEFLAGLGKAITRIDGEGNETGIRGRETGCRRTDQLDPAGP